jgi:hypothetical protein
VSVKQAMATNSKAAKCNQSKILTEQTSQLGQVLSETILQLLQRTFKHNTIQQKLTR